MEKPKLIIFDLNKTLIEENSWLNLNTAMGVTQAEDDMLMAWGHEGVITDAQGQAILCEIYKARGNATKNRIKDVLLTYKYHDGAQMVVKKLQSMGCRLALLSGSIDMLVEHIADELDIELYASNNQFYFDANDTLVEIKTIDNDETYKACQLEKFCKNLGIAPNETWCVGDGDNDSLLFDITGNGVTFTESPIASRAKYVIESLQEIPSLLI